jgi:heptosyltransferase-2
VTDEARAGGLVVRAPNHLGELILALPALEHAAALEAAVDRRAWVQLVTGLCPVLELAGLDVNVLPLDDRRAVLRAALRVRRAGVERGILLTPSASSALIFRLANLRERRGTAGGWRTGLLTDPVEREPLLQGHRVHEFLALVGGDSFGEPPAPRLGRPELAARAAATLRRRAGLNGATRGEVALFPGAKGESRRWPADRFAELARRLAARGWRVLVLGGPAERSLTASVSRDVPGSGACVDLGGWTSLVELAGLLSECDALVTNDTGPMHLAAAMGCPVVALEGPADVRQTRPLGPRVRLVGRFDLVCVPCVRNRCPRTGRGELLADAHRECMRLITVDEVESALDDLIHGSESGE